MSGELFSNFDFALFFHLVGVIIGLGAVTVIDTLGFISRKSKSWTQTTIQAHHVTKPLIWLGTLIILGSWIFILNREGVVTITFLKSLLLIIMLLNGVFLSFNISPKLDKLRNKKVLLPKKLQIKIAISMIISFLSWWSFVILTFLQIKGL